MAAEKALKSMRSYLGKKTQDFTLTHFLCIPITTTHSRPQLEQALHQFKTDPSTSQIPSNAYRPLQTLHIPIRPLRLPGDRVDAACQHLQSLNIADLLQRTPKGISSHASNEPEEDEETPPIHQGSVTHVDPTESRSPSLTITLSGVYSRPIPDHGTLNWRLSTPYTDSTHRLVPLLNEIRLSFDAGGFSSGMEPADYPESVILLSNMPNRPKKKSVPDLKKPGRLGRHGPPVFETKDIVQKFENFAFAENFRLEKLSLCKLGLHAEIERHGADAELQEVCSAPLP